MESQELLRKLEEAERLVAAVPEERRTEARIAVLTSLLLTSTKNPAQPTSSGQNSQPASDISKIVSVRQISKYTKRKGVSGDLIVVAFACYLQDSENRRLTTVECRDKWSLLSDKTFATTFVHRAETKGWLSPVEQDSEHAWEVTPDGRREWGGLQQRVEKASNRLVEQGIKI